MPENPSVAVVVATHNRAERLPRLVAALEAQDLGAPFEIVFVDDASTDGTWGVLENLAGGSRASLRTLHIASNSGPAHARNKGWRSTTAEILAFTDDDCLPERGWLRRLLAGFGDADIVQGSTVPAAHHERDGGIRTMSITHETGLYETCNIAFTRALLEKLGGFDEVFRYAYGEDADLGWRARALGARTAFRPDAVVEHEVTHQSVQGLFRDLRRLDGVALLLKRHPAMRVYFYRQVFYRRSHLLALLAVAGAGVALRRPRSPSRLLGGALLAMPWAALRSGEAEGTSHDRRRREIPMLMATDIAEIAFLAMASIRHRTFVL